MACGSRAFFLRSFGVPFHFIFWFLHFFFCLLSFSIHFTLGVHLLDLWWHAYGLCEGGFLLLPGI